MDTQTVNFSWMVCSFVLLGVVVWQAWVISRMGKSMDDAQRVLLAASAAIRALGVGEAEIVKTGPGAEDFVIQPKEGV